jgi:hypothetical protein
VSCAHRAKVFARIRLKAVLFYQNLPKSSTLALCLVLFVMWLAYSARQGGVYHDLALVGILACVACACDMAVAILGDGQWELVRHLFLANVLFDVALIATGASLALWGIEMTQNHLPLTRVMGK